MRYHWVDYCKDIVQATSLHSLDLLIITPPSRISMMFSHCPVAACFLHLFLCLYSYVERPYLTTPHGLCFLPVRHNFLSEHIKSRTPISCTIVLLSPSNLIVYSVLSVSYPQPLRRLIFGFTGVLFGDLAAIRFR